MQDNTKGDDFRILKRGKDRQVLGFVQGLPCPLGAGQKKQTGGLGAQAGFAGFPEKGIQTIPQILIPNQNFFGIQKIHQIDQLRRGQRLHKGIPRGHITPCHGHVILMKGQGAQKMRGLRGQQRFLNDRAWGQNTDDLAPQQDFVFAAGAQGGLFGGFHLLGDGHFVASLQQQGNIGVQLMPWNAAHGRGVVTVFVAFCQLDFQAVRHHLGVFKKNLIKIPHTKQHDTIGMLILKGLILGHHGG